jgi:hypothetical protein
MDEKVIANGIIKVKGLVKMVGISEGKREIFLNYLPPPPPEFTKGYCKSR